MHNKTWSRKRLVDTVLTCSLLCWLASASWAGQPPPVFNYDRTVALSKDGALLAIAQGDNDNNIGIIETATGRTLRVLAGCGCTINNVVLSPDGRLVATYATICSGDTYHWEAKLWDIQTGKLRRTLEVPNIGPQKNGRAAFGFTAGGLLAATTENDIYVRLWNTRTGKRQRLASWQQFFFSSDGAAVAMTAALSSILAAFPPTRPLEFSTFSQNRHFLLTISGFNTLSGPVTSAEGSGKTATLWNAETGKRLRSYPLEGHQAYCGSIRYGKVFVGGENYARLWSVDGGPGTDLWHEMSVTNTFDGSSQSHIELTQLTQRDKEANMVAVKLKPFVNKDPQDKLPPMYTYTKEARFVRVDAITGRKKITFVLTGR